MRYARIVGTLSIVSRHLNDRHSTQIHDILILSYLFHPWT